MLEFEQDDDLLSMLCIVVMGSNATTRRAVTRTIPASDPEGRFITLKDNAANLEETIDEIIDEEKADIIIFDVDTTHETEAFFELLGAMIENEDLIVFSAIAVIDLPTFWHDFDQDDPQQEQSLTTRVETTPFLVLANAAETPTEERRDAEAFIRSLNPAATVVHLDLFRKLNLTELAILNGIEENDRLFRKNLQRQIVATEDADLAGFSSYAWTENARIDRSRLEATLNNMPAGVLTGSGSVHTTDGSLLAISIHRETVRVLEGEPDLVESLVEQVTAMGLEFDEDDEELTALMHGSTITLIGRDLDDADLNARFAACIGEG